MRTYKVGLNTTDLTKLSSYLRKLSQDVKGGSTTIVTEMVSIGLNVAQTGISNITDLDGNSPGVIQGSLLGPYTGVVSNIGPQVAFLEFGTGITGQASPHMLSGKVGWAYNQKQSKVANRTINGVEGWFYYDQFSSSTKFTNGIRPNSHMLATAMYLRNIQDDIVRSHIGRWLIK